MKNQRWINSQNKMQFDARHKIEYVATMKSFLNIKFHIYLPRRRRSGLERSPCNRKVECSKPS